MRSFLLSILFFMSIHFVFSQNVDVAKLNYDYLSHDYNHLDNEFRINISSVKFDSLVVMYKFYPERIKTCRDSLSVVLMGEFNDWDKARIAKNRIVFSYLRLSYYLWTTKAEAKKLCEKYDIKYPYRFYQLCAGSELNWDQELKDFIFELKNKVEVSTKNNSLDTLNNKEFLKLALVSNPQRQKDYERVKRTRKVGVSCGKANCCQNKKKK